MRPTTPPTPPTAAPSDLKSKALATWVALLGGPIGLHRLYLYGLGDRWAWLYPFPTMLGAWGLHRVRDYGQDDHLAWVLIPILGFMVAFTMLQTLLIGLTPDERWHARHNPQLADPEQAPSTGWLVVAGLVVALLLGATALMSAIAFSGQRYFEYQVEEALKISQ
jgi:hypothetical protein